MTLSNSSATAATAELIAALQDYSTCDVSDALCKLKHPFGGFLPGMTMWSPERQAGGTKIIGPAYTVQYAPLDHPRAKASGGHYIDSVPTGAVIYISCPPYVSNAAYGGLMSQRARVRGAVGTIVDGRIRDLDEQRDLQFPVFAREIGTAPPYGEIKVVAVDADVQHTADNGFTTIIKPGDLLIADVNGVVVLPLALAQEAIPLMAKQVSTDTEMANSIRQGLSFSEASKLHRS